MGYPANHLIIKLAGYRGMIFMGLSQLKMKISKIVNIEKLPDKYKAKRTNTEKWKEWQVKSGFRKSDNA